MRHNHFRSIFPLFLAFVPRVASFLPHPTKAEHAIHQGVSPIPTQGPYLMELATESSDTQDLRRLAARQNPGACAYVSGIQC